MIIELFGPPGVGKTTFAAALTDSLRERGCVVDPIMSCRPAERSLASGAPSQAAAAVRRVLRPLAGTLAAARPACAGAGAAGTPAGLAGTPAGLIGLLPPRNLMWSVRLHQYLLRLFRSWESAAAARHAVLFDQAFVQAVGSLALLSRAPDWDRVAAALDAVPKPDVLILLGAPRDVLEARLAERQRRQGRMERLLELDLPTNLRSVGIINRLNGMLAGQGQPVVRLDCTSPAALHEAVAWAGADLTARFGTALGHCPGVPS